MDIEQLNDLGRIRSWQIRSMCSNLNALAGRYSDYLWKEEADRPASWGQTLDAIRVELQKVAIRGNRRKSQDKWTVQRRTSIIGLERLAQSNNEPWYQCIAANTIEINRPKAEFYFDSLAMQMKAYIETDRLNTMALRGRTNVTLGPKNTWHPVILSAQSTFRICGTPNVPNELELSFRSAQRSLYFRKFTSVYERYFETNRCMT